MSVNTIQIGVIGMKKRLVLLLAASLTAAPALLPLAPSISTAQAISQQQQGQRLMSFGGSLTGPQLDRTRELLGGADVAASNIIYIDGNTINQYLRDGSNQNTIVYSSALVIPQAEGHGVRIEIVTPQNILLVSPATYQNAAITAGARNVLIRIASVEPVTGEGALTGLYAMFEATGQALDPQAIEIAEREITIINQIEQEEPETNTVDINHFVTYVKQQVTIINVDGGQVNRDVVVNIINNYINEYNIELSDEAVQKIIDFILEYAETPPAQDPETIEQLEIALSGDWRTMLSSLDIDTTMEEFETLDKPDYSNAELYHPITQAMVNRLYDNIEAEPTVAFEVYNDSFLVENMVADLSIDSRLALNYIRALSHQLLMATQTDSREVIHNRMVDGLDYLSWMRQDQPERYNEMMQIAFKTRLAPQVYEYVHYADLSTDTMSFYDIFNYSYVEAPNIRATYASLSLDKTNNSIYVDNVASQELLPYEIPFPEIGPVTEDVNFEAIYGVAIENNFVPIEIPEEVEEESSEESTSESIEESTSELPEESSEESTETSEESSIESSVESSEETTEEIPEESSSESIEESVSSELPVESSEEVVVSSESVEESVVEEDPYPPVGPAIWDIDKAFILNDYMSAWSTFMGQEFRLYTPEQSVDFKGAQFPNAAIDNFALDGLAMDAVWSPNGNLANAVNVVAAYSDIEDFNNPAPERHVYLFVVNDGQLQVLVNEMGMDASGLFNFSLTQNEFLAPAFEAIMNNQAPEELPVEETPSLWNEDKDQALADYMTQFNQIMGQNHISYTPENNGDFYGVPIFPDLIDLVAIDEIPVEVNWLTDELQDDTLNIVAVYSNIAENREDMEHYLYLFSIENGEPMVYVTAQNQGQPDGLIHFAPSQNQDLQSAFQQIVEAE